MRAQATVEFALVLPLIVASLLSVVGVTAVCTERLRLADVARLCARAASTADDPVGMAEQTARDHRATAMARIDPQGNFLTVTVQSNSLPGVGFFAARAGLSASTTVVLEQSPVLG